MMIIIIIILAKLCLHVRLIHPSPDPLSVHRVMHQPGK